MVYLTSLPRMALLTVFCSMTFPRCWAKLIREKRIPVKQKLTLSKEDIRVNYFRQYTLSFDSRSIRIRSVDSRQKYFSDAVSFFHICLLVRGGCMKRRGDGPTVFPNRRIVCYPPL